MQRGRKPANPALKELSGTYRKDRHADIVALDAAPSVSPPVQPSYLTAEARLV
ncbi:hypothetical protein [Sphingomonas guangdongensis]|uniref:hypothetical protein n=1 Tax=Sphingomonas guangdongensis TaxID=1141890 RepID=UPI0015CB8801|nr:hypothetical protein [Sphingomonas guangdongensis]